MVFHKIDNCCSQVQPKAKGVIIQNQRVPGRLLPQEATNGATRSVKNNLSFSRDKN